MHCLHTSSRCNRLCVRRLRNQYIANVHTPTDNNSTACYYEPRAGCHGHTCNKKENLQLLFGTHHSIPRRYERIYQTQKGGSTRNRSEIRSIHENPNYTLPVSNNKYLLICS